MDPLKQSANALRNWCVEQALPYWAKHGQRADNSWVEHLHLDGRPDHDAERRWRVLARQVYVYAKASSLGWYDGREVAISTYLHQIRSVRTICSKCLWRLHKRNRDACARK